MDTAYFFEVRCRMANKKYETQFSIYKVDFESSVKYFEEEYNTKISSYSELENYILDMVKKEVLSQRKNEIINFTNNGFKGLVFKTCHYPTWYGMIDNMIEEEIDLSNTHISYILSYLKAENIFLLTGGLGSNYISEYTQKNYGLYLLPKIMKENSPVIKTVLENRMSGNRLSSKHSNRNVTTISTENDMSSIFRELSLEIDKDMIELLGIEIDKNKKIKNLNLIAKDSFVIRKSISIEDLIVVLNKLIDIEKNNDNFSLGYFIDAKKYGYSYKYLNELFIQYLMHGNGENFILIGDEYSEYCVGGNLYVVQDNERNIIYQSETPITIADLYKNGYALVFRLAVNDYHRYVFFDDGELISSEFIKGELHTIRPVSEKYKVYARNSRVVNVMDSKSFGIITQVEIGALLVGKIVNHNTHMFSRLEEKGYFEYGGSTIVMFFPPNIMIDEDILRQSQAGYETQVFIGDKIGQRKE